MDIVDQFIEVNNVNLEQGDVEKLKVYLKPLLIFPDTEVNDENVHQLFFTKPFDNDEKKRSTDCLGCM